MLVKPAANPAFDKTAPESRANPRSLLVYDPALKDYLPAHGRDIGADHDLYWHRRQLQGEVVLVSAEDLNAGAEAEAARMQAAARAEAEKAKAAPDVQPGVTVAPAPEAKKTAAPAAPKEGK